MTRPFPAKSGEMMKLSKDKASLFYNDFLTLSGIPAEVYDYRLGNRSALEWVAQLERLQRMRQGEAVPPPLTMEGSERG
jgi:predicted helicase